jgi:hypothetical protein
MRTPTVFIPTGTYIDEIGNFGLGGVFAGRKNAAPIYAGITVTRSGSGTRSKPNGSGQTRTQSISYSTSQTYNRKPESDFSYSFYDRIPLSDGSIDEFTETRILAEDEVIFLHSEFGSSLPTRYNVNPKKHYLFIPQDTTKLVTYGSETVTGFPPFDLDGYVRISTPSFGYLNPSPTPPDTLPVEYDAWACQAGLENGKTVKIDVTGYSATKWRNLKGVYILTIDDTQIDPSWDTNSVVHTVEWTIF